MSLRPDFIFAWNWRDLFLRALIASPLTISEGTETSKSSEANADEYLAIDLLLLVAVMLSPVEAVREASVCRVATFGPDPCP